MLWRFFHHRRIEHYIHGEEPWAFVSGASDGIGKAIAAQLLSLGCNVILHGRNHDKLVALQKVFASSYPRSRTHLFVFDASQLSSPSAPELHAALAPIFASRRITLLVNNVGYVSTFASVSEQDPSEMDAIINCQIRFMTHLTRAAVPHLSRSSPSLVINVTGLTAEYPAPYLAVHSGGKAYVQAFSRALSLELDLEREEVGSDVRCIAVDVHNVASNSNSSAASFFTPTASTEASAILSTAASSPYRVVTAYWRHELIAGCLKLLPRGVMDKVMSKSLSDMRTRGKERAESRSLELESTSGEGST